MCVDLCDSGQRLNSCLKGAAPLPGTGKSRVLIMDWQIFKFKSFVKGPASLELRGKPAKPK